MTPYAVLLRAINVGGRNKVAMADLRATLGQAGFGDVRTYIASGNVVLTTELDETAVESAVERALEERFGFAIPTLARGHADMRRVVDEAPAGFTADKAEHHCDALFLKGARTTEEVMAAIRIREGVDEAWAGQRVVYFRRLTAERTKSTMSSIVGTPIYQDLTIRNWRTTLALLALLDERE